ncbi:hypothetical protein BDV93DRAFT_566275 [Ceratobasidium sp. AG-I]|nr:hypothetical protein BDV93DRAFT_566275 [Ceratobasidium sp. AG-I]
MSEDEDSYEAVENEWVLKEHEFRSREWEFISSEVKKIRTALDSIPEPKANVSTAARIRGPVRTGLPPANRVLKWLLRPWMIKENVLSAHPEWIEDGRVVKNGKAWGDSEDPVERSASLIACLEADQPEVVAALEASRAAQQAEERALEIQGGGDLTVLASALLS